MIIFAGMFLMGCGVSASSVESHNLNGATVPSNAQSQNADLVNAKVTDVIDGDTVKVMYKGKEETIRMLLIDTPETHHPKLGVQPYGMQASNYMKNLLTGKTVQVEPAVNEGRDKYGRLLAYLFIDGQSVQQKVLEKGLARVAYIYPPNTKYLDEYRAAEAKAKEKKIGVWSVTGYAREDGYHPEVMKGKIEQTVTSQTNQVRLEPDASGNCGGHIKGNISSNGDKIYHLPSDRYYKVTKAEQCFINEQDAVKAGFRAPGAH